MTFDIGRQSLGATTGAFLLLLVLFALAPGTAGEGLPAGVPAGQRMAGEGLPAGVLPGPGMAETGSGVFPLPGAWLDAAVPQPWNRVLAALALLAAGLALTLTSTRYMLYGTRSYLPMLAFLGVCCGPAGGVPPLSAACCALLLTYAFRKGVQSFKRRTCFDAVFRAGLVFGLLPLLYAPAVVLAAVLPAALAVYKRGLREAAVATAALLLPLGAGSYLCWAASDDGGLLWETFVQALTAPGMAACSGWGPAAAGLQASLGTFGAWCATHPASVAAAGTTALVTVLGTVSLLQLYPHMRTRTRKIYRHLLFLLAACLPLWLLPGSVPEAAALLAVPAGLAIPAFFVRHKGTAASVLSVLWPASLLAASLFPIILSLQ